MSRNKCFFQVRISHVLCFISVCDLLTDTPFYNRLFICYMDFKSENYLEIARREELEEGWRKLRNEALYIFTLHQILLL
jgi:hypothetical protein